jgi:hypothetical protein
MSSDAFILIAAAICFVFEAANLHLGTINVKWWALGVALWILAQAI